jgi:hypothetical protein
VDGVVHKIEWWAGGGVDDGNGVVGEVDVVKV